MDAAECRRESEVAPEIRPIRVAINFSRGISGSNRQPLAAPRPWIVLIST
jgi:hypothetical protein